MKIILSNDTSLKNEKELKQRNFETLKCIPFPSLKSGTKLSNLLFLLCTLQAHKLFVKGYI